MPSFHIHGTNKNIGDGNVFIIAEIGKNFIQSEESQPVSVYLENAKRLIDAAVTAGVDAVKFQTHEVEDEQLNIVVTSPHFRGSDRYSWVKRNTDATPLSFWQELKAYADTKGVLFFSTPMSRKAAVKLQSINVPLWKVGSGDVDDFVLIDYLADTAKPVIISTGMVSLAELDEIVAHYRELGLSFAILYCVSKYPAPKESFNLATIELFREKYPDILIGFSDHSVGDMTLPLAAVRMGATIIEKHFSLSRDLWGSDHKVSMTPSEMKALVDAVRRGDEKKVDTRAFYGEKGRELEGASNEFRDYFKKGLVAGRDIPAGAILRKEDIFAMRPRMYNKGLPSGDFHKLVGQKTVCALRKYDPITKDVCVDTKAG